MSTQFAGAEEHSNELCDTPVVTTKTVYLRVNSSAGHERTHQGGQLPMYTRPWVYPGITRKQTLNKISKLEVSWELNILLEF